MSPRDITPLLPTDEQLEARRHALVAELDADAPIRVGRSTGPRRGRHWLRGAVVVLTVGALGGGIAVAAGLLSGKEVAYTSMACSSQASREPAVQAIVRTESDPVAACQRHWQTFANDPNPEGARQWPLPVPEMVACAGPDNQGLMVYPTSDPAFCASVDLEPLPADFAAYGDRVRRISKVIDPLGNPPGCPTADEMKDQVREVLKKADLDDVKITVGEPNANFTCAFASPSGLGVMVIAPKGR